MKLLFVSLDSEWINLAEENDYDTYLGKVQDYVIPKDCKNIYYISPANCLGFMDGGVEKVYSQIMFPGIESKIKEKIKKLGFVSKLGRPYIPIGKAIVTKTDILHPNGQSYLITSPTMLMPQNVENTPNCFLAMIGVIKVLKEYKHFIDENDLLIIPSMCCGWGKMKPEISIRQIKQALEEKDVESLNIDFNKILQSQPKFYENTEWIDIPSEQIINN
jgi:O-acetyl-ADP-ribose deacetylase (regulator of RNase III)